ncbi:alkylated DNA repair protein [Thalassotalea insulae]|uniref:Alkylated DNA repair protein n=1 Tax=Thalassotalea insulae TaxID=2056778 RepID=A0ABQ6GW96_9GAMM|nr:alpha-ketoglutarate-dependent dioxygenase AlkB [Thalassotalea insulae]GLX79609.1 alkylated DNA repair protein [Thalassotalea insulae]
MQYYPNFIPYSESLVLARQLFTELSWREDQLLMFGKYVNVPRLQAWYAKDAQSYSYSKLALAALPLTPGLTKLNNQLRTFCQHGFNSVLANCYRDHNDSVAWHSDDEPELGPEPMIASLSFGAERVFHLKHKATGEKCKIPLQSGSLLVMAGQTQHQWQHAILKTKRQTAMRINLTFRKIY